MTTLVVWVVGLSVGGLLGMLAMMLAFVKASDADAEE